MNSNTQMFRATLVQEFAVIVNPEDRVRKVTIYTPGDAGAAFDIDKTREQLGISDAYKAPQYPPNLRIPFRLMPGQYVVGASIQGIVECSVIVEYLD